MEAKRYVLTVNYPRLGPRNYRYYHRHNAQDMVTDNLQCGYPTSILDRVTGITLNYTPKPQTR